MEDLLFGKRSGEGKIKKTTTTAISNKVGKSEEQIKQEQKKNKDEVASQRRKVWKRKTNLWKKRNENCAGNPLVVCFVGVVYLMSSVT